MRPLALIILDGWGYASQKLGNAIVSANTPNIDYIKHNYPSLLLQASGKSVGLEWGEPGNSEVGHLTIGAGRTIFQYSTRINRAIENGEFNTQTINNIIAHVQKNKSSLHLIGLLSSGTVHSSFAHLIALLDIAKKNNLPNVFLHLFTDGKDSGLKEAPVLIKKLRSEIERIGVGTIASIIGRMYAMDRDTNWDRTQKAYNLWTKSVGEKAKDPLLALETAYNLGFNDTSLEPIMLENGKTIDNHDAIFFFNYREDSMRQISRAFADPEFKEFPLKNMPDIFIGFMTQYFEAPNLKAGIAFPLPEVKNGPIFSIVFTSHIPKKKIS